MEPFLARLSTRQFRGWEMTLLYASDVFGSIRNYAQGTTKAQTSLMMSHQSHSESGAAVSSLGSQATPISPSPTNERCVLADDSFAHAANRRVQFRIAWPGTAENGVSHYSATPPSLPTPQATTMEAAVPALFACLPFWEWESAPPYLAQRASRRPK